MSVAKGNWFTFAQYDAYIINKFILKSHRLYCHKIFMFIKTKYNIFSAG